MTNARPLSVCAAMLAVGGLALLSGCGGGQATAGSAPPSATASPSSNPGVTAPTDAASPPEATASPSARRLLDPRTTVLLPTDIGPDWKSTDQPSLADLTPNSYLCGIPFVTDAQRVEQVGRAYDETGADTSQVQVRAVYTRYDSTDAARAAMEELDVHLQSCSLGLAVSPTESYPVTHLDVPGAVSYSVQAPDALAVDETRRSGCVTVGLVTSVARSAKAAHVFLGVMGDQAQIKLDADLRKRPEVCAPAG